MTFMKSKYLDISGTSYLSAKENKENHFGFGTEKFPFDSSLNLPCSYGFEAGRDRRRQKQPGLIRAFGFSFERQPKFFQQIDVCSSVVRTSEIDNRSSCYRFDQKIKKGRVEFRHPCKGHAFKSEKIPWIFPVHV